MPALIAALLVRQFFHDLVDREAAWLLARRELLECRQELPHDRLCGNQYEEVLNEPSDIWPVPNRAMKSLPA